MSLIYETENFLVESADEPLVTRTDGGHITITPRIRLADRLDLAPKLAVELMYLTMLTGEAMSIGLNRRGIDIGRINYQDNGNWGVFKPEGPYMHYHIYGRAKSAKIQKYGSALHFPFRETGFYNECEPLDSEDIAAIRNEIVVLIGKEKYSRANWGL